MSARCREKVYDGSRADMFGHRCSRNAVDGLDGYCKFHYPANVSARNKERAQKWRDEALSRSAETKRKAFERAEELRKLYVEHFGDPLKVAVPAIAKAEGRQ